MACRAAIISGEPPPEPAAAPPPAGAAGAAPPVVVVVVVVVAPPPAPPPPERCGILAMASLQAALALSVFSRRHMKASRPSWPGQIFFMSAPQAWTIAARAAAISGEGVPPPVEPPAAPAPAAPPPALRPGPPAIAAWQPALTLALFWRRHMKASRPFLPSQSFLMSAAQAIIGLGRSPGRLTVAPSVRRSPPSV